MTKKKKTRRKLPEGSMWMEDWLKKVEADIKKNPPPPFKPSWWYNKTGDQIEVYWENVAYYAKWLNPQITLYLDQDDDRVVGLEIAGIRHFLTPNEEEEDREKEYIEWRVSFTKEIAELKKQNSALHAKAVGRGQRIKIMQEEARKKNIELSALRRVWCSGGCPGGVKQPHPTKEEMDFLLRNTERLIQWWNSKEFKKLSYKDKSDYHKFLKENREK